MNILGLRSSNTDCTFVVMTGTRVRPTIVEIKHVAFPKSYLGPYKLKWFRQEVLDIIRNLELDAIAIKGTEALARRNKSFVERTEFEAIIQLVGAEIGIRTIVRKVKSTIAKDLGLKGKAKYLNTKLDTSPIPEFESYKAKEQEAILVAWSELE